MSFFNVNAILFTRRTLTLLTTLILYLHLHLHLHCTAHTYTIYTYNTYNTISNHLIKLQLAYSQFFFIRFYKT